MLTVTGCESYAYNKDLDELLETIEIHMSNSE
jgi:hypothetical protein